MELLLHKASRPLVATRRDGRGCGHWAARFGRQEVLRRLLRELQPDVRSTNGLSMAMCAAYGGHVACLQLLLAFRADLNLRNARRGASFMR